MSIPTKLAATLAALLVLAVPAAALAGGPTTQTEKPHPTHPAHPIPGPQASMPEKAKAYGVKCRGFSKKRVKGEKGTPFSRCVVAAGRAKKQAAHAG